MNDLWGSSGTADWILLTAFHSLWLSIAALVVMRFRTLRAPAVRSAWCTFILILLLILPLITWAVPRTVARQQTGRPASAVVSAQVSNAPLVNKLLGMKTLPKERISRSRALMNQIGLLWLAVTLGCVGRLLYELAFLKGYCTGQQEVEDGRVSSVLQEINESFGFRRQPRFFVSPNLTSPVSMGMQRPLVLFPANLYPNIGDGELRAILLHELAHIYHYDHVLGLLQRIVKALYWWNPFIYRLCNALSLAREEVSDNYVISGMNSASSYAALLVSLIEKTSLISRMPCTAGMATPYESLETRIKNIVSKERDMRVKANGRTVSWIAAATVLLCGLIVAGSQVEVFGVGPASYSVEPKPIVVNIRNTGSAFSMKSIQGSVLVLEAPDNKQYHSSPITVNGDRGNCEFAESIPPGPYKLVISFFALRSDLVIPPTPHSALPLNIDISRAGVSIYAEGILQNEDIAAPESDPVQLDASNPPMVLSRVELEYPPEAKEAKIAGSMSVEVVVNEKGEVYEARILSGHPWFSRPALNAVMKWKFQPLVVNGAPKPFVTKVSLDFHY